MEIKIYCERKMDICSVVCVFCVENCVIALWTRIENVMKYLIIQWQRPQEKCHFHSVKCCTLIKYIWYRCWLCINVVVCLWQIIEDDKQLHENVKNFGLFASCCSDQFNALISCPKFKTFVVHVPLRHQTLYFLIYQTFFKWYFSSLFQSFQQNFVIL